MSVNTLNPRNEFTVFRNLPVNVQQGVWFHALPRPRVFALESTENPHVHVDDDGFVSIRQITYLLETLEPPPIILQVCRDSRGVALRHYQAAFGAINGNPIYFSFQRDILDCTFTCLDFGNHMPGLLKDLARVENLCTSAASHWVDERLVLNRLAQFKSLRVMVTEWIEQEDEEVLFPEEWFPEGMPMYEDFVDEAIVAIGMMAEGKGKEYKEPLVLYRDYSDIVQLKHDVNHWWTILEENGDDDGDDEEGDGASDEVADEERGGD